MMIFFRKRVIKWILLFVTLLCVCLFYASLLPHSMRDLSEHDVYPNTINKESVNNRRTHNERIIATETSKIRTVQKSILTSNKTNTVTLNKTSSKHEDRVDNGQMLKHANNTNRFVQPPADPKQKVSAEMKPKNALNNYNRSVAENHHVQPHTRYTTKIAIVSLLRNAESSLESFGKQLIKLSYPHNLLSVYFGESESTDNTFKKAENVTLELKKYCGFNDSGVIDLQMSGGIFGDKNYRHRAEVQMYRRSYLAFARNRIVRHAMQKQHVDYIITIDSDIVEFPADLVQQLLFARSDIVATSCMVIRDGRKYLYDANSWRETEASLKHQASLPLDALVVEGYSAPRRIFLPQIRNEGSVVKLDGVGGCTLMIKADCFRSGLVFPNVLYKRHIETEGLAKMARDMGYSVVGLPFVEVYHYSGD